MISSVYSLVCLYLFLLTFGQHMTMGRLLQSRRGTLEKAIQYFWKEATGCVTAMNRIQHKAKSEGELSNTT